MFFNERWNVQTRLFVKLHDGCLLFIRCFHADSASAVVLVSVLFSAVCRWSWRANNVVPSLCICFVLVFTGSRFFCGGCMMVKLVDDDAKALLIVALPLIESSSRSLFFNCAKAHVFSCEPRPCSVLNDRSHPTQHTFSNGGPPVTSLRCVFPSITLKWKKHAHPD